MELVQSRVKTAGTDDVKQVIKDMQNSPTAAYMRDLSFHERLMLAVMLKCIKKEGVEEIRWGDVSSSSRFVDNGSITISLDRYNINISST